MSLKQELQTWADALEAFDKQDFGGALSLFERISDTSKIQFNIGIILATLGGHDQAVSFFDGATALDPFLAVAFFQAGVSYFLLGRYAEAKRAFDEAFMYLRGNDIIDYEQLGLKFKLYSCEVLFNRGLSCVYLGRREEGLRDLAAAQREKRTDEHGVIDEALADRGEGYTVFSCPVGVLFRPSDNKIQNLASRDYLGQAKVVAASDANDLFVGFSGTRKLAASAGTARSEGASSDSSGPARSAIQRSQTSSARLQRNYSGLSARFLAPASTPPKASDLKRSKTADGAFSTPSARSGPGRSLTSSPQPRATRQQLPTPPPSDEQHPSLSRSGTRTHIPPVQPQPGRSLSIRKTYGTATSGDILDDYYANSDLSEPSMSLPPPDPAASFINRAPPPSRLPIIRPSLAAQASVRSDSQLERVADWAQHNALPSDPRGPAFASPPPLSRENSATSSASSQRQISFAPFPESRPGDRGQISRQPSFPPRKPSMRALARPGDTSGHEAGLEGVGASMRNLSLQESIGGYETRGLSGLAVAAQIGRSASRASAATSQAEFGSREMAKVRVKLRYKGDTRGMSVTPEIPLGTFVERVRVKFGKQTKLDLKYKDSDNAFVSILDDDDWESAMDQAREAANGRAEGKLEISVDA
ncbi:hypothetical protein JCM11641_007503 [Rhodosporidiobolus odoratus]